MRNGVAPLVCPSRGTGFNRSLKLRTSGTVSKANKWSNKNNGLASSLPLNTLVLIK